MWVWWCRVQKNSSIYGEPPLLGECRSIAAFVRPRSSLSLSLFSARYSTLCIIRC